MGNVSSGIVAADALMIVCRGCRQDRDSRALFVWGIDDAEAHLPTSQCCTSCMLRQGPSCRMEWHVMA